jgi:hypothetical protein
LHSCWFTFHLERRKALGKRLAFRHFIYQAPFIKPRSRRNTRYLCDETEQAPLPSHPAPGIVQRPRRKSRPRTFIGEHDRFNPPAFGSPAPVIWLRTFEDRKRRSRLAMEKCASLDASIATSARQGRYCENQAGKNASTEKGAKTFLLKMPVVGEDNERAFLLDGNIQSAAVGAIGEISQSYPKNVSAKGAVIPRASANRKCNDRADWLHPSAWSP